MIAYLCDNLKNTIMAAPKGNKKSVGLEIGRPKGISSPEDMYMLFIEYKKSIKDNPQLVEDYVGKDAKRVFRQRERPLTMEGFETFVSWTDGLPATLDQYFSNKEGRYEDFIAICTRIRQEIRQDQINGGMVGIYNPSITARLNGLADKKEAKVIMEQPLFGDE